MTTETGKFSGLQGVITSVDQIRATIGEPPPPILAKVIDHVDDICRDIIAKSPFASREYHVGPDGRFLMQRRSDQQDGEDQLNQVVLVQNWFEELKQLVPIP